jgi:hypothetical protein
VLAKLRPLNGSKRLRTDEFEIDLKGNDGNGSVTCPAGVATTDFRMARDGWQRPVTLFRFPREVCTACELREQYLGGPAGRALSIRCASHWVGRCSCTAALPRESALGGGQHSAEEARTEEGAQGATKAPSESRAQDLRGNEAARTQTG